MRASGKKGQKKASQVFKSSVISKQDRTRQNTSEHNRTRQNMTEHNRTKKNMTEQDRTRQNRKWNFST